MELGGCGLCFARYGSSVHVPVAGGEGPRPYLLARQDTAVWQGLTEPKFVCSATPPEGPWEALGRFWLCSFVTV